MSLFRLPHLDSVRHLLSGLVLTLLTISAAASSAAAAADELEELRARERQVKKTLAKVSPAVVSISDGLGAGSGVIVSEDGLVLTAGHVLLTSVEGDLQVTLSDGAIVEAERVGRDLNVDAGMIRLRGEGPYPYVELGTTRDMQQGAWCLAIGHPGGYQLGRTAPVRLGRLLEIQDWMLVTDCALVGGDSGGPLFNLEGELIGINSSIGPSVAENRHGRIDEFQESWERMLQGQAWGRLGGTGPPDRDTAYLGVELNLETPRAVVDAVVAESAAEAAGLQVGDTIMQLNGHPISDSQDLLSRIAREEAGQSFRLQIKRGSRELTLQGSWGRYADRPQSR